MLIPIQDGAFLAHEVSRRHPTSVTYAESDRVALFGNGVQGPKLVEERQPNGS